MLNHHKKRNSDGITKEDRNAIVKDRETIVKDLKVIPKSSPSKTENSILLAMSQALEEAKDLKTTKRIWNADGRKSEKELKYASKWKWFVVCKIEREIHNAFNQEFVTKRTRLRTKPIEGFSTGKVGREDNYTVPTKAATVFGTILQEYSSINCFHERKIAYNFIHQPSDSEQIAKVKTLLQVDEDLISRRRTSLAMQKSIRFQSITRRRQGVTAEFNSIIEKKRKSSASKVEAEPRMKSMLEQLTDKYGASEHNEFYTPQVLHFTCPLLTTSNLAPT